MGESDVAREGFKTPWWDASSQQRMLAMRCDQPTIYRVTGYELIAPSEEKVREILEKEPQDGLVVELPPAQVEFQDIIAHEVNIVDGGHLVVRKIAGVGMAAVGWETVAIFPPGTWKKCEAIQFRESK